MTPIRYNYLDISLTSGLNSNGFVRCIDLNNHCILVGRPILIYDNNLLGIRLESVLDSNEPYLRLMQ